MQLILEIDTSNKKAQEFISLIRALDFVKVSDNEDNKDFYLTDRHKGILKNRKENHINGKSKSYSWEEVKISILSY